LKSLRDGKKSTSLKKIEVSEDEQESDEFEDDSKEEEDDDDDDNSSNNSNSSGEEEEYEEEEEEEEDEDEDEDEDEEVEDEASNDENVRGSLNEIKKILGRQTLNDKRNKELCEIQQSRYQLEIHSPFNRGLHLDPQKRFKRNMRTAHFDKGLKDERGLNSQDFEYAEMNVEVNGRRIKVDPRSVTLAQYKQMCPIEYCPKIFKPKKPKLLQLFYQ